VKEEDDFTTPQLKEGQLPAWTYALRPFSKNGELLGIGRLYVKVLQAEHLPPMNDAGLSDVYCTVNVCEEKKTTKVVKSLSPSWEEEFAFNINNGETVLNVELFSADGHFNDTSIAKLSIPVFNLSHQQRFSSWYPITLSPEAQNKMSQSQFKREKSGSQNKSEEEKEEKEEKEGKEEEGKEGKESEEVKPRIRLELHYTFSKIGQFLSFFSSQGAKTKDQEVNVDVMFGHAHKIFQQLNPLWEALVSIITIIQLQPVSPAQKRWRMVARFMLIFLAFQPWCFLIGVEIFLIRFIIWQYMFDVWSKKEREKQQGDRGEPEREIQEVEHLSGPLNSLALNGLAVAGVSEQMGVAQTNIELISETIERWFGYFQWKNKFATIRLLVFLIFCLIYSAVFPQRHLVALFFVWLMIFNTVVVKAVLNVVYGLRRFLRKFRGRPKFSLRTGSQLLRPNQ